MSADSSADFVLLGRLADEFAARYRAGERPELQEYIDRHPDLAHHIRELFPAMVEIEQVKEDHKEEAPAVAPVAILEQLGDYRIIREVGRGGMGVVYEAEQISLGRHVALKVLPRQLLVDARTKQRFEREARAAARLHHTNIVPVFGVGEHEGLPYYVMQFIQGTGLDVVIEELARMGPGFKTLAASPATARREVSVIAHSLATGAYYAGAAEDPAPTMAAKLAHHQSGPAVRSADTSAANSQATLPGQNDSSSGSKTRRLTYWQSVARVGLQVAEALEYAHKQGIIHRDVKPSNLLLDLAGTVWVTDFGLAKTDDQQNLTHSGDILGTLRYMPPESFNGKFDARSDVYSLGLTLYELVAQRPAFAERDRNKLIKQVTTSEATPVGRVRKGVPRDLETIIHKAIEREPERRYQKAEELAEDLRRFLADRTIQARRATLWEQTQRWARRNPAVAALLGVVTILLIGVSIASSVAAVRMTRLATNERSARQVAEVASARERWERYRANIAAASAALQLQRSDGARRALEATPEQHRNWEWQHFYNQLDGASHVLPIADLNKDYLGRPAFAFGPGDRQIASATGNVVNLWDANSTTGPPAQALRGHTQPVLHLAYSPDGRQLATGSGDSIRLWDPATGQQRFVLAADGNPTLAYSADGKRLIANQDGGKHRLWDATTGKLICVVGDGPYSQLHEGVTLSPDGKRVAAVAGKVVRLYDALTGQELASLGPHEWLVEVVHFSPDGKRICTHKFDGAGPDTVYVWDAATSKLVARLTGHRGRVAQAVFNADSTLLATAGNYPENLVRLWDATNGKLLYTLGGHTNSLYDLTFSPDGTRLASGSMDQTARLWDAKTGAEIAVLRGHWSAVRQVIFSPDSKRLVTGSQDQTMRLWNARNGEFIAVLRGQSGIPWGHFTGEGSRLISISDDGAVRLWDLNLLERNGVLRGHTGFVYDVAFSPDGEQVVSVGWDGTARIWNATTGRQDPPLKHPQPYVTSLSYSRDGRTLATGNTGYGAVLWDLTTHQPHLAVPLPSHARVSLSPDNKILACTDYQRSLAVLYDTVAQRQITRLTESDPDLSSVNSVIGDPVFSPDGATLATNASGGKILLWDVATWKVRGSLPGYTDGAYRFAFSADSRLLAVGALTDNSLSLWDVRRREQLGSLKAGNSVLGLAFNPDGTRLAAGCRDNTIRLIDVPTWQEVAELRGHTEYVHAVAWSPDGTRLVSGSGDGTVRIWDSLSVQERAGRASTP